MAGGFFTTEPPEFKAVHFIGIVVCILGMGCMAGADVLVGRHQGAGESPVRQVTCLCG